MPEFFVRLYDCRNPRVLGRLVAHDVHVALNLAYARYGRGVYVSSSGAPYQHPTIRYLDEMVGATNGA